MFSRKNWKYEGQLNGSEFMGRFCLKMSIFKNIKPIYLYILQTFISFGRMLLGNGNDQLRLRLRWHFKISNQCYKFYKSICLSVETVY